MRRSSKVILVIAFLTAAGLVSFYVPLLRESQPDFTEQDASLMLGRLSAALDDRSADRVMAFAAPDAVIAGRTVEQMRLDLRRGFTTTRSLDVTFSDVKYTRQGDTVTLDVHVKAGERQPGSTIVTDLYYDDRAVFTLQRRELPQMGGLFSTYEWRVTRVTAANLPRMDPGV